MKGFESGIGPYSRLMRMAPASFLEGHGVTEILSAIGNTAAIETDKLGFLGQRLDFLNFLVA